MATVTQFVWNPNFLSDVINILDLNIDENGIKQHLDQIKENKVTYYEKLRTLIDRIEFIKHLKIVSDEAEKNNFRFSGEEVVGIHWDIHALRLYLSLTCIDILSSNFETFDKWIIDNCQDVNSYQDIKKYIKKKADEYATIFRISSSFAKAFHNSSDMLKARITDNISVIDSSGIKHNDLATIICYFYRIRNKYTHEGRRFHQMPIPLNREQSIGKRDNKKYGLQKGLN